MRTAIFGATGQVGTVMRSVLAERSFPVDELRLLASERSAGRRLPWAGDEVTVEAVEGADLGGIDVALCSMGAAASRQVVPRIVEAGALVVDNSSAWRMDPEVPLVVPEVNAAALDRIRKGIVANPNCTTMVAMPVLAPLHAAAGLRRVVAATYQAVSGARHGVAELEDQLNKAAGCVAELTFDGSAVDLGVPEVFPAPVALNVVPMAGDLVGDETVEERKFRDESRKILGLPDLAVSCTCVRVPVVTGHSLALHLELEQPLEVAQARRILAGAPGVALVDLPTALGATGTDDVLVGRVRCDPGVERGLALFVSGDNLRKGAALNAVQIAEELVSRRR